MLILPKKLLCIWAALTIALGCAKAEQMPQISAAATIYLDHALDIMQQNSFNKKNIDWIAVRKQTLENAAGSQNPVDTYEAIRFALRKMNDHHSFLQLSPQQQSLEKEAREKRKAGPIAGVGSEKWPPSPYIDRRSPSGSIEEVAGVRIARVVVPMLVDPDDGQMHAYAETLGRTIATLAKEKPAGWVVDLRGNLGGNMWPMLAGVGPLEGQGVLGSFLDAAGNRDTWFYGPDGAGAETHDGKRQILCWIPSRPVSFTTPQIVAVLVDHGTASSGEAIAISFQGMPQSRSFGRDTHGQSTSNDGFLLSDGANLVLTTGVEADRTGRIYVDGITPDVVLTEELSVAPAGTIDPMTKAAALWIGSLATAR